MLRLFKVILFTFICISLIFQLKPQIEKSDLLTHFNESSTFSISHHDNIEGTDNLHTHTHKHSEGEPEHDHHHEHLKVSSTDFKILSVSYEIKNPIVELFSNQIYSSKFLLSNFHPFRIFRPPII